MQMHCHPSHRNCHCPPCRPGSLVVFSSLFYFILYSIFCFSNSSPDLSSCCYSCTLDCTSHAARCTRHLGLLTIGHRPHSTSLCRINNILEKKKKKSKPQREYLKNGSYTQFTFSISTCILVAGIESHSTPLPPQHQHQHQQ